MSRIQFFVPKVLRTGRARLIKRDSLFSPSVLKSQNRQAKKIVCLYMMMKDDRYYFTSNNFYQN